MSNFRLFIALDPTPETVAVLRRAQVCLRDVHWSGARWLPPEQWHATLRFLGATPEDQVQHWKHTLQQFDMLARDAAPLPIDGVAIWPAPAHPRVIVVTAKFAIWAQDMATRLEALAREAGYRAETRAFHPHVTLARVGAHAATARCLAAVDNAARALDGAHLQFGSVSLFVSRSPAEGPAYERLATMEFRPN
ncbi:MULTISPECIES: RNA 2',3'-cyclic phosphodiesterase [Ralstonia]|jgi:2'-5' RNA ligase|uniref:RNA 2',3'-cyclic phosphodiesterase n=4 Tax=Pseudomonadota TaxID=1224 RepID=A0AAD2AYV9_9RALS|nr:MULTISPECIES: RNA 2',3'-cyclic phosphodiesterase [Ralstonia]MBA9856819.1 RNA 2',3'-cyclic phosphodiesterase [Ralstonia insidiosa]MBA9936821.1 RNA 2',3'-cyclic phosphodiesterase [Ralstonia insidiosa]MBA9966203.1 RNA 2',3'-cyclic phosphodiesterase [Ralstonia pickettii]MBB0024724.1 RNA 2',3'-cyclic phosphodiesterase [Ralstonia pickettii]MBB0035700.1 RNA 2',3'-cyclic phosphodiesterase [Ralstonia pickettii]